MLGQLALKGRMTTETLNTVDGVRCNEVMGAMYAFPRIFLPDRAIAEAKVSVPYCYLCAPLLLFRAWFNVKGSCSFGCLATTDLHSSQPCET